MVKKAIEIIKVYFKNKFNENGDEYNHWLQNTQLHRAAKNNTLKDVPIEHFTEERLMKENILCQTVWHIAVKHNTLKDIPQAFINKELLNMKNAEGGKLFNETDASYINEVIANSDTLKLPSNNSFSGKTKEF